MLDKIRLQNILRRIQSNGIGPREKNFLEGRLLYKYDDNSTYLDYIIEYYPEVLEDYYFPFPKGNADVAYILAKNKVYTQLKNSKKIAYLVADLYLSIDEDDLFKMYDGKFLIYYFIYELEPDYVIHIIKKIEKHAEIIDVLKDLRGQKFISRLNPILIEYIFREENGHAIIEKYLSNDYIFLELLKKHPDKSQVLAICKKYNKEHLINQVFEEEFISQLGTKLSEKKFQDQSTSEIDSDLINEFEQLFKNEMREEDFKILVSLFKEALSTGNTYAHQLLSIIIEEKKKDKNALKFEFIEETSHCSGTHPILIRIDRSRSFPETLFHEVGHCIHSIKEDFYVPDDIINMVLKIRENFHTAIGKELKDFAKNYQAIEDNITQSAREEFDSHVKITDEEFEKYLESLNLPPGVLEQIKQISNKEELFIEKYRDYFIKKYLNDYMSRYYSELYAISDIVDAIFGGLFYMNGFCGHGDQYYNDPNMWFIEMVADYIQILCLPGCDFYLNVLRTIIGDEMFKLLDDYCQGLLNTKEKKKIV